MIAVQKAKERLWPAPFNTVMGPETTIAQIQVAVAAPAHIFIRTE
jgi:hypothetical protein